jgi:hypothetical protein
MPLRWIEVAEARQVLATAQSEAPPAPYRPDAARSPWAERVRRWVAAGAPSPSPEENREENPAPPAARKPRRR